MMGKKIIIICGPTGIGKTNCAILLASRFKGEIVGADAVQVYRGLDIGSAKPTTKERSQVPHHLIDIVWPNEPFDAAMYERVARNTVCALITNGVLPFVTGGTGLYIRALLNGLFVGPKIDPEVRKEIKRRLHLYGTKGLYEELQRKDPHTAARLHPNDSSRLVRALEVVISTGRSISEFQKAHRFSDRPFDSYKIGLTIERKKLYDRINKRVDAMISEGFVEEVKGLLKEGYGSECKPMQALGYRHMISYLKGEMDWEKCVEILKRDHRHYAKRQMTWFQNDPEIHWYAPEQIEEMAIGIKSFMNLS